MDSQIECPICMDVIESKANTVITECGHSFHCSCLMKNAVHNGFGCPYCRTTMAEEPEFSEDDEDEEDSEFAEEDEDEEEINPPLEHIIENLKEQNISYETLARAYCFDELIITNEEDSTKCLDAYNDVYKNISDIVYNYRKDMFDIEYNESPPDVAESKNKQKCFTECY
jgi:hypothetical protein